MVTEDEALGLIKSFILMTQTQFAATIKIIKSNNALELSISNNLEFFGLYLYRDHSSNELCSNTSTEWGCREKI